jgi:hypothetical protein
VAYTSLPQKEPNMAIEKLKDQTAKRAPPTKRAPV